MKHIYYINEEDFSLKEGYVTYSYKNYEDNRIYEDKSCKFFLNTCKTENIFDNIETAKNMLKGMIKIQMNKLQKYIDDCTKKREELFEKMLNI